VAEVPNALSLSPPETTKTSYELLIAKPVIIIRYGRRVAKNIPQNCNILTIEKNGCWYFAFSIKTFATETSCIV
jgi:hypothetical protein